MDEDTEAFERDILPIRVEQCHYSTMTAHHMRTYIKLKMPL